MSTTVAWSLSPSYVPTTHSMSFWHNATNPLPFPPKIVTGSMSSQPATNCVVVQRGDIWLVSLDPSAGHEQQGTRPVLIVSPDAFNKLTGVPVVLPITTGGSFARRRGFAVSLEGVGTLRDVLGAVNELRGEMGEVRIGLGDVRGRLDRVDGRLDGLTGEVAEQGHRLDRVDGRLDRLTGEVAEQGHRLDRVDGRLDRLAGEVETLRTDLPAQVVAGVLVGFERSAYATDLRTLQAEVAELKADMAELKRASGE